MSLERALWMLQALAGGQTSSMDVTQSMAGVDLDFSIDGSHQFCVTGRDLDEACTAAISELEQRIDLVSQLEASCKELEDRRA